MALIFGMVLLGCATTNDLGTYHDISPDKAATLTITGRSQGVVRFNGETVDWRAKPSIFASMSGGMEMSEG